MPVTVVNSIEDFELFIAKGITSVYFSAQWCGPCKIAAPQFESISKQYPSLNFYKVDIDDVAEIAPLYNITGLPSLVLFKDGALQSVHVGANTSKFELALATLTGAVPEKEANEVSGEKSISNSKTTSGGKASHVLEPELKPELKPGLTSKPEPEPESSLQGTPTKSQQSSPVVLSSEPESTSKGVFPLPPGQDLESILTKSEGRVVAYFYANWCGPCKILAPRYEALAQEYPSIYFCKIDADNHSEAAESMSVSKLPTLVYFKNGQVIRRTTGIDIEVIREALREVFENDQKDKIKTESQLPPKTPEKRVVPRSAVTSPEPSEKNSTKSDVVATSSITTIDELHSAFKATPITVLFFPFVSNPEDVKPSPNFFEVPANRSITTNMVAEEVKQPKYASKATLLEVNYLKSPSIAEMYGVVDEKAPIFKILHKGIHFATISKGDFPTFQKKLAELVSMY